MRPEPSENHCSQNEDAAGNNPVVKGQHVVLLPEPDLVDEAFPVALHQVIDRVELDQVRVFGREDLGRPEDGGEPESELEDHGHQLSHIAQEDDQGGGEPGEPQQQHYCSEEVVEHLEVVKIGGIAVENGHDEDDGDEEAVDHEGREDLDDGEHADAEDHLL